MSRTNQPWTPVESILKALDSVAQGKERQKVGILGAGMAGLAAAYELKKRGHQVEILEGSERVGGRVWAWPCSAAFLNHNWTSAPSSLPASFRQ